MERQFRKRLAILFCIAILLSGIVITIIFLPRSGLEAKQSLYQDVVDLLQQNGYVEATPQEYEERWYPNAIIYPYDGKIYYLYKYKYKERREKTGAEYAMCFEDSDGHQVLSDYCLRGEYTDYSSVIDAVEYYQSVSDSIALSAEKDAVVNKGENYILYKNQSCPSSATFIIRKKDIICEVHYEIDCSDDELTQDKNNQYDDLVNKIISIFTR